MCANAAVVAVPPSEGQGHSRTLAQVTVAEFGSLAAQPVTGDTGAERLMGCR